MQFFETVWEFYILDLHSESKDFFQRIEEKCALKVV